MEYLNDTTENCSQLLGTTFLVFFHEIYFRFNDVPKMDEMVYLNFIDVSKVHSLKQNHLIRRFVYMLLGLSIETV